ncbi:uncharacterized protein CEXT_498991 [Caerostris extrusa]|uniref:Uncharacterized protein n=1 Tax=Caerostris extrusa TaxID=172846 RepID=A0AAV4TF98_CAEEX|nr:uncharacterized protein CEXT_498991 [Caerostris extrusa]
MRACSGTLDSRLFFCRREKIVEDVFASDEDFKGFFSSLCVLKAHVPADQKDQFEEDLYQEHLRQNGRDKQGLPYHRGRMIEVVVKKD